MDLGQLMATMGSWLVVAGMYVGHAVMAQKVLSLTLGGLILVAAYLLATDDTRIVFVEGGNGTTTTLVDPNDAQIISTVNALANRQAKVTHLYINSHASPDSMILRKDPPLYFDTSATGTAVVLRRADASEVDLTARLNTILEDRSVILLEGCETGYTDVNLARDISLILTRSFVVGGKTWIGQLDMPFSAAALGGKRVYRRGSVVREGPAVGSIPSLAY